jgi:hypothetical protein
VRLHVRVRVRLPWASTVGAWCVLSESVVRPRLLRAQVYGAFETLSDPAQQRRLLFELGFSFATTEKEKAMYEKAGAEDDDDVMFQWWWEASVPDVEKAAEEAQGADMDTYAASWVSDGLGGDVNDVRWIGIKKAMGLYLRPGAPTLETHAGAELVV